MLLLVQCPLLLLFYCSCNICKYILYKKNRIASRYVITIITVFIFYYG